MESLKLQYTLNTVESGYNVIKGTECFVSL
jgi:hypothetical protein